MKIVAFDLATRTGVAVGDARQKPTPSTEILGKADTSHGARFTQAFRMTQRIIRSVRPDAVVIEEPIAAGVAGNSDRVKLAMGYRAAVAMAARVNNVTFHEYRVDDIRAMFIGKRHMRRHEAKVAVFDRCVCLGWKPADDNESDACAVWAYASLKLAGIDRPQMGGLFGDQPHDVRNKAAVR